MTSLEKCKILIVDNKSMCNCNRHLYHESCDSDCNCIREENLLTTVFETDIK